MRGFPKIAVFGALLQPSLQLESRSSGSPNMLIIREYRELKFTNVHVESECQYWPHPRDANMFIFLLRLKGREGWKGACSESFVEELIHTFGEIKSSVRLLTDDLHLDDTFGPINAELHQEVPPDDCFLWLETTLPCAMLPVIKHMRPKGKFYMDRCFGVCFKSPPAYTASY